MSGAKSRSAETANCPGDVPRRVRCSEATSQRTKGVANARPTSTFTSAFANLLLGMSWPVVLLLRGSMGGRVAYAAPARLPAALPRGRGALARTTGNPSEGTKFTARRLSLMVFPGAICRSVLARMAAKSIFIS